MQFSLDLLPPPKITVKLIEIKGKVWNLSFGRFLIAIFIGSSPPPKTAVELIDIRENLKIFASSGLFVKLLLGLRPPSRAGVLKNGQASQGNESLGA